MWSQVFFIPKDIAWMNVISRSLIFGWVSCPEKQLRAWEGVKSCRAEQRPESKAGQVRRYYSFVQGVERGLTCKVKRSFNVEVLHNLHYLIIVIKWFPDCLIIYLFVKLICHTWRFFCFLFLFFFGASPLTAFFSSRLCSWPRKTYKSLHMR